MKTRIILFHNTVEIEKWLSANCNQCKSLAPDDDSDEMCPLYEIVQRVYLVETATGHITKKDAEKLGYVGQKTLWGCPKFVAI